MIWLILAGATGLALWLLVRQSRKRGEAESERKGAYATLKSVEDAQKARDGLNDPAKRKRVRDKFTRK